MKQSEIMSKRVFLTLPDEVVNDLERWADKQGRAVANLAAYLVEFSVQQAKERGEIPPRQNTPNPDKSK
ncbi:MULTISPECIES: ribbon-helix-helix domain-containing protein [Leptolyngbya]|uniref:ribbon-helix-helix domain-containing protein n=1 Tax=Leptolyngbya TaxID=47251 RepID=UPI0018EF9E17